MQAKDVEKTIFLGIEVVNETKDDLVKLLINRVLNGDNISVLSISLTVLGRADSETLYYLEEFDYVTADGMGVVKLSGLIGDKLKEDGYIPAISNKLLDAANELHLRVFLLGATEEINKKAVSYVLKNFPNAKCNGRNGYFKFPDLDAILDDIKSFDPHIILVGISSPIKERIIMRIKQQDFHSINVACGGYLDILGGKTKDASPIVRKLALQWLYRFIQEPRRLYAALVLPGLKFLFYIFPIYMLNRIFMGKKLSLKDILGIS